MNEKPTKLPHPPWWLTEIPLRSSQSGGTFKFHTSLGKARAAISHFTGPYYGYKGTNPMRLWQWDAVEKDWVLLAEVTTGMKSGDLPWNKP